MSDDRLNRGQPDRSKMNMSEDYEMQYWTKHLGVSREELQRAVDKVGNSAVEVRHLMPPKFTPEQLQALHEAQALAHTRSIPS